VPVFVGDDVLETLGVDEVAIVKIDVEGGELDVLEGLTRTLSRSNPLIFCEVLPIFDEQSELGRFRAPRQAQLSGLLQELGYVIFRIHVDETIEQLPDFGGPHSDMTLSNYIFVPRAEVPAFRRTFGASSPEAVAAAS